MATLTFKLPELSTSRDITWQEDIDSGKLEYISYDMIIDRDLLHAIKIIIDFDYQVIKWDDVRIPKNQTKSNKNKRKELHAIFQLAIELETVQQASERFSCILDVSYEKVNLFIIVENIVVIYLWTDMRKS